MYVYTHHIFIHSSVDAHLGYFLVLAIVNIAVMNIAAHVFFELSFPLGICSGVVLLGSMVVLFLYVGYFRGILFSLKYLEIFLIIFCY